MGTQLRMLSISCARLRGVACALTALLMASSTFGEPAEGSVSKPNIIFILADDLGYGDLGCYGQKTIETPSIDRMAAEGVRFTQFYSGSTVCAPSRCVLMTGLHTGHARVRGNSQNVLLPEDVTVAEVLRSTGYTTGLVGKWGLGNEGSTGLPTRQGFDFFFGYLDQAHAHNYYPSYLVRNEQRVPLKNVVPNEGPKGQGVASEKVEYSHDLLTREALAFVDRHATERFFLYLAYTLPHANNEAGKRGMEVPDFGPYVERDWPDPQKGHAAMITRLDRDVGRLFAKLREKGIDTNTIVLFTSDNGPHQEGGGDPSFFDANGPLRGIKRDLYEGGIRVPMIVRWPGKAPAGATSDHIGYFADFLATAADLSGVKVPGETDGISFLPSILGKSHAQKAHDALYWEFYERGSAQGIRMGRWKGVVKPFWGSLELYDLETDIGETTDVAKQHPEIVERLRRGMESAHVPSESYRVPTPRKAQSR